MSKQPKMFNKPHFYTKGCGYLDGKELIKKQPLSGMRKKIEYYFTCGHWVEMDQHTYTCYGSHLTQQCPACEERQFCTDMVDNINTALQMAEEMANDIKEILTDKTMKDQDYKLLKRHIHLRCADIMLAMNGLLYKHPRTTRGR